VEVVVGLAVGLGVKEDVGVIVGGGLVQVAGSTTRVPVGIGVLEGRGEITSRAAQPDVLIWTKMTTIQNMSPAWPCNRSGLRIWIVFFDSIYHLFSAVVLR
jgi:hypothetical protein